MRGCHSLRLHCPPPHLLTVSQPSASQSAEHRPAAWKLHRLCSPRHSSRLYSTSAARARGPPDSASSALSAPWSSLPLSSAMLSALARSSLDVSAGATGIQQSAIRACASVPSDCTAGSALLLAARTGTGKTLAALIPALERAMAAERHGETSERREELSEGWGQALIQTGDGGGGSDVVGSQPFASSAAASATLPAPPPSLRLSSPASLFSIPSSSPPPFFSGSSHSPSLLCRPLCVLVAPSRELVDQHYRTSKALTHFLPARVERLMAGRPRAKERRDLRSEQHGVSVLVSTPTRLLAYIERGLVSLSQLRTVVLDEADVLLSAASDGGFKDDCVKLIRLATAAARSSAAARQATPSSNASLLFILSAASVPPSLRSLLPTLFPRLVDLSTPQLHTLPPAVRLDFVAVHSGDKLERLLSLVRDIVTSHPQPRVLLFCNSLPSCRAVHAALTVHFQQRPLPPAIAARYSHSPVLTHHGDLPSALRAANLQSFRSGACCVLVVTDLLSRGIDLPQLSHVLQFDMSLNPTDFMHRVGRLARQPNSDAQYAHSHHQQQRPQQQHAIALVRKGDEVLARAIAAQFQTSSSIAQLSSDKRQYSRA